LKSHSYDNELGELRLEYEPKMTCPYEVGSSSKCKIGRQNGFTSSKPHTILKNKEIIL
jgi:hypothetical protein